MNAVQKYETLSLAPAERLPFWNDVVDRVYTGTWVNTAKTDFVAEMWRWKVGDLDMIRPRSDPAQVGRAADRAVDEEQIVLHLQRRGISNHRQDRREASLAPGDFILMSTDRPYKIDLPHTHELMVVQFPRRLIEHKIRRLDDRLGTAISGACAGGRVFHDFLLSLWHQGDQSHADPDWQAGVASVFADLVALAVNVAAAGAPAPGGRPRRRGRAGRANASSPWSMPGSATPISAPRASRANWGSARARCRTSSPRWGRRQSAMSSNNVWSAPRKCWSATRRPA
jgi:hypothetical protein